jgi:hypothetical protein
MIPFLSFCLSSVHPETYPNIITVNLRNKYKNNNIVSRAKTLKAT